MAFVTATADALAATVDKPFVSASAEVLADIQSLTAPNAPVLNAMLMRFMPALDHRSVITCEGISLGLPEQRSRKDIVLRVFVCRIVFISAPLLDA